MLLNIWATFARNFVHKNFQISSNLVTLQSQPLITVCQKCLLATNTHTPIILYTTSLRSHTYSISHSPSTLMHTHYPHMHLLVYSPPLSLSLTLMHPLQRPQQQQQQQQQQIQQQQQQLQQQQIQQQEQQLQQQQLQQQLPLIHKCIFFSPHALAYIGMSHPDVNFSLSICPSIRSQAVYAYK